MCPLVDAVKLEVYPRGTYTRARCLVNGDDAPPCPVCRGSRKLFWRDVHGREYSSSCAYGEQERIAKRLDAARIPARFHEATLDERFCDAQNLLAFNAAHHRLRDMHLDNEREPEKQAFNRGIMFMGPPGVGKSFLAAAMLRSLIVERGARGIFQDFTRLLTELRDGYASGRPESELLEPLIEIEVLVIDDLGKGRSNEWERDILDRLISGRYNRGATTIVTTNYSDSSGSASRDATADSPSPSEAAATTEEEKNIEKTLAEHKKNPATGAAKWTLSESASLLVDRVGARVRSRLHEMCGRPIEMSGGDRREGDPLRG